MSSIGALFVQLCPTACDGTKRHGMRLLSPDNKGLVRHAIRLQRIYREILDRTIFIRGFLSGVAQSTLLGTRKRIDSFTG
jgi:hypothetical protein